MLGYRSQLNEPLLAFTRTCLGSYHYGSEVTLSRD